MNIPPDAIKALLREGGTGVGLIDLLAEALRVEHKRHTAYPCHPCELLNAYDAIQAKREEHHE